MKNKCTWRGNCNITPCLRRRPLGFCIQESGIHLNSGRFKILSFVLYVIRQLLPNPSVGVVDFEVIRVYSQSFRYSVRLDCNLLGGGTELEFTSLILVERGWRRRCVSTREWGRDTAGCWSASSRRGKELSSEASESSKEVCLPDHVEQLLFYSLMDVLHMRLHVYQGSSSSHVLWFPRGVIYECLEPLGVGEEAIETFAFRRISDTLHDGRAEVRLREESVANQVLVLLSGEERVFGNNMGELRTDALGGVREFNVRRGVSGVRRRVSCTTTTSMDCGGGHCIELNMK